MQKESKFKKLGRLSGKRASFIISICISSNLRQSYRISFSKELADYSFRPHKEREERHEGCRRWINELDQVDYRSPEQHAIYIKAEMDALQQKKHARNYYLGFLEGFS